MKVIVFFAFLLSATVCAEKSPWISINSLDMPYDVEELENAHQIRNVYLSERYGDLGISSLLYNIGRFSIIDKLSECRNNMCPFVRGNRFLLQKVVDLRSRFEKQLIKKITQKVEVSEPLILSSVNSGDLFSEFVILNKLVNHGYRDITINLIDRKYTKFIEWMLNPEHCHSFESIKKDALAKWDSIATITFRFVQFTRWFQNYGDDLKVKVIIYGNLETYLFRCMLFDKISSDAIAIIDPQLGYEEETGLANMSRRCLKKNGLLGVLANSVPDQILIDSRKSVLTNSRE